MIRGKRTNQRTCLCLVQGKEKNAMRNAERQEGMYGILSFSLQSNRVICSKKEGERRLEKSEVCPEQPRLNT